MADNPNKKAIDANRASQKPHEQTYQKQQAERKEGSENSTKENASTNRDSPGQKSSTGKYTGNRHNLLL